MRILFLGASEMAVCTAESLIEEGHDVVLIESNAERIEELSDHLDCSFLHGDGGRVTILKEAGIEDCDLIFCISDDDKANILAGLVARHLGVERIVVSLEDKDLETVADSLDLETVIVPARALSRQLHDIARGIDSAELSTSLKYGARLFRFVIAKGGPTVIADLELPNDTYVAWYYHDEAYRIADADTRFAKGDEVVLLTRAEHLHELAKRLR